MGTRKLVILITIIVVVLLVIILGCKPQKAEMVKPVKIADNDYEPANWGKA